MIANYNISIDGKYAVRFYRLYKKMSWQELKEQIENSEGDNIEITLANDLEVDATITIPSGKKVTIIAEDNINIVRNSSFKDAFIINNGNLTIKTANSKNRIIFDGNKKEVDAENRVIVVKGTLVLENVTIQNNKNTTNECSGGAIAGVTGSTISLKNVAINNNENNGKSNQGGGAIYCNGLLTINNSTISNNISQYYGGAIFGNTYSKIEINNTTILNNISKINSEEIYSLGKLTIDGTVINKLTGMEITTKPTKTSYVAGQSFSTAGMVVTARYNDGSTKAVTGYTVTDGTNLTVGKTTVTISYTENGVTKTTTQGITVVAKSLTRIEIKKNPSKVEYYVGEDLNLTGLVLKLTYNDDSTREITEGYTANVARLENEGEQEIKVSYGEKEVTLKVTVLKENLKILIKEMDEDKSDGITYLSTTTQDITEEQLKSKFETNGDITIEAKGANGEIGTGSIIKIGKNEEIKEYTLVITGDLTGDGILDDRDLLRLARYGANLDKNLIGVYLRAANLVKDDTFGDDRDLLKMARVLVGLDSIK